MALFDRTINIQAPLDLVWQEAYKFACRGRITSEEPNRLLVATQLKLGYVYFLQEEADGSTRLRHLMDTESKVQEGLYGATEIPAALDALSVRADTPGREALSAALGAVMRFSPKDIGDHAIKEIKKKAEHTARQAQWTPQPVTAPAPTTPPVPQAEEFAVTRVPGESQPPAPPPGKPPWNPRDLTGLAILFSFGASGILAGLNWRRLGKPQWTWPTILLSVIGLAGFVVALVLLPGSEAVGRLVGYGINVGIGALLTYWQTAAYKKWVAAHGQPTRKESGYLIPIVVALGTLVVVVLTIYSFAFLREVGSYSAATDHYNRGVEYQQQGQLDLAIKEYTQAIATDPKWTEAYLNRGTVFIAQDDYDRAIADCDQAITLDPKSAMAYSNRGLAYALKGDFTHALTDLDTAITLDPKIANGYFVRGMVYAEKGEREKAINDLEKALSLGLNPDAKQNAEATLQELKR